jgi:hypothetical protein
MLRSLKCSFPSGFPKRPNASTTDVTGELHAPDALPQGKGYRYPLARRPGIELRLLGFLAYSLVAITR